jgi:hypothetical protein
MRWQIQAFALGLSACTIAACSTSAGQSDAQCRSTETLALRAQLWTRADHLSAALSTLQALDRHDTAIAYSTLEAELTSNITVLRALLPEASEGDRGKLEEELKEAEIYAHDHKLRIVKPRD